MSLGEQFPRYQRIIAHSSSWSSNPRRTNLGVTHAVVAGIGRSNEVTSQQGEVMDRAFLPSPSGQHHVQNTGSLTGLKGLL